MSLETRVDHLERMVADLLAHDQTRYESGTWTPTYYGASTAGTTTYNASFRYGYYTRVGRAVLFSCIVAWSAATGTGQVRVGGLPFTVSSTAGMYFAPAVRADGITFTGTGLQAVIVPATTFMQIESPNSNAAPTAVAVESAGSFIISGMYFV